MERLKNKSGITLIALVITIIILIILAGVTLNMLLGENGLITRTKTAKEENEKATATETMNLKITNVQISKYAEEQRMPTLKELADNFCEDNDFEKVIEKTEVGSLTKISNENPTAIITKLRAYPYEFEINSSLQLASIDGVKVATLPANDEDTIVSMTKAELKKMIQDEIANTLSLQTDSSEIIMETYTLDNQTIAKDDWANFTLPAHKDGYSILDFSISTSGASSSGTRNSYIFVYSHWIGEDDVLEWGCRSTNTVGSAKVLFTVNVFYKKN